MYFLAVEIFLFISYTCVTDVYEEEIYMIWNTAFERRRGPRMYDSKTGKGHPITGHQGPRVE
jgi:hypothetical protein